MAEVGYLERGWGISEGNTYLHSLIFLTKFKLFQKNSNEYIIDPVTIHNRGSYACLLNDKLIKRFNVTVYEFPQFTKKMQKLQVKPAGNMIRLNCKSDGVPTPSITWYKNDQTPPRRGLGDIKTSHWSLILEDLVPADKGNYTCVICNIVGCNNFTFNVDVIGKLEWYEYYSLLQNGVFSMHLINLISLTLICDIAFLYVYSPFFRV